MDKAFSPFSRNSILLPESYLQPLVEAARSQCYVENTGNKADSLHRRISMSYEEDLLIAYQLVLAPLLKKQHISCATLAVDFTDEDFYGLTADPYLHPWTGEEGVEAHYKFAVLSLVKKHKIPLMAVPVHLGMDKAELVKMFLAFAKKLFRRIHCILLDAGFYSGAVIEALRHETYLIRAPRKKSVMKLIEATPREEWKAWPYEVQWDGNRTRNRTPTTIVIVRGVKLRDAVVDCSYATNMALQEGMDYVHLYCRRWQIETNFRMEDQVHIKSKSVLVIIRYFYFLISMLLHALWLMFWSKKMAFDAFKIHAANQLQVELYGVAYVRPVL